MRPFDYLSVLFSIVISLAITHVLVGIAQMIRVGVRNFSVPLAFWVLFVLFQCIDYWFSLWHIREETRWPFAYVIYLLVSAAVIFVTARLVVPADHGEEPVDMAGYFEVNRRKIAAVLTFGLLESQITNLTVPGFGGLTIWLMVLAYLAAYALLWFGRAMWMQYAAAAATLATTIWYVMTYLQEL